MANKRFRTAVTVACLTLTLAVATPATTRAASFGESFTAFFADLWEGVVDLFENNSGAKLTGDD